MRVYKKPKSITEKIAGCFKKYIPKKEVSIEKDIDRAIREAVCEKERKRKKDYDFIEHSLYNKLSVKGEKA
jgi:hypothetical protein